MDTDKTQRCEYEFFHLCLSVSICGKKLPTFTFHQKWSIHLAMQNYYVPIIVEQTGRGERSWDIYSRLLVDRIIFVGTAVDDNVANILIAQLLFLQMSDPKKDIHLYINLPGGSGHT